MKLDPRANQKARTRGAIVEAAGQLIARGQRPTVAEAAEAALVSRATAYRYFPTQESLWLEAAAVSPVTEPIERALVAMPQSDPALRLAMTTSLANAMFREHETTMRMALRSYLDAWLDADRKAGNQGHGEIREGRRTRWIENAIGPVLSRMDPDKAERLRCALSLTIGIEALVVLRDVCRLSPEEAGAVLDWTSHALLAQALQEGAENRVESK